MAGGEERVLLYVDAAGKWRYRIWKGSRVVASASQGYANKRLCLNTLTALTRTTYERVFETRRTFNARAYQQGVLRAPNREDVPVEVTPWHGETDQLETYRRMAQDD